MKTPLEVRLPVDEYRALPIPGHSYNGKQSRLGTCFVRASDIPSELGNWMDVNPRKPETKASSEDEQLHLTGRVAKKIIATLESEPGQMALRNQGIYLLVEDATASKAQGGQETVTLRLSDPAQHGVVNGGHTFFAVRQVYGSDAPPTEDAWVRLHILQNVDPDNIVELAEGLNRSIQVKSKSLDELQGYFKPIKDALRGKKGENAIIYAEGDAGEIDIEEILVRISMFNLDAFPDEKKQPNGLFGSRQGVLSKFEDQFERVGNSRPADWRLKASSAYARLVPATQDILVLWDRLYAMLSKSEEPYFGLLGKKRGKPGKQAPDPFDATFADVEIDRKITGDGLVYPIFAAFRANVDPGAWKDGKFRWKVPLDEIIVEKLDDMCRIVREEYDRTGQPRKPAEVGKKPSAYRQCYQEVALYLLGRELRAKQSIA